MSGSTLSVEIPDTGVFLRLVSLVSFWPFPMAVVVRQRKGRGFDTINSNFFFDVVIEKKVI